MTHQKQSAPSAYQDTASPLDSLLDSPLRMKDHTAPIAKATIGNPNVTSKWASRIKEKPGNKIDR